MQWQIPESKQTVAEAQETTSEAPNDPLWPKDTRSKVKADYLYNNLYYWIYRLLLSDTSSKPIPAAALKSV